MKSCVFIGGGNMASCIVSGLSNIHTDEYRITVCDPNQTKLDIGKKMQCAKTLDMSKFSGIIDYKPEELYIKVKAGTPINFVREELKKNKQHLAFEPVNFSKIFVQYKL